MSDYYKSLISDEEVIRELIKESKRREGKLPTEVTRLRPNLNFFQRTVNNLVSNNTRLDKTKDALKSDYVTKDASTKTRNSKTYSSGNPPLQQQLKSKKLSERKLFFDSKIKFVKPAERLTKINIQSSLFDVKSGISTKVPTSTAICANDLDSEINSKSALTCKTLSPKLKSNLTILDNDTDIISLSSDDSSVEFIADYPPKQEHSPKVKKHEKHDDDGFKHKKRKKE